MKRCTPRQVPTTFCARPDAPNAASAPVGTRRKSRCLVTFPFRAWSIVRFFCIGRKAERMKGSSGTSAEQRPQHVEQDPAVPVVLDLGRCVDPHAHAELGGVAAVGGGAHAERAPTLEAA